jgi:hypothetical protein
VRARAKIGLQNLAYNIRRLETLEQNRPHEAGTRSKRQAMGMLFKCKDLVLIFRTDVRKVECWFSQLKPKPPLAKPHSSRGRES